MTRLDSAIRRLTAQRDLLDWAAREIAGVPGLVLELGLGNGRTYDHLRARLPERAIYVFERRPAAHPACMPAPDRLVVGDVFETLPRFADQIGPGSVALIHADLGTGDEVGNRVFCRQLSPLVAPLLAPGACSSRISPSTCPLAASLPARPGSSRGATSPTGVPRPDDRPKRRRDARRSL